MSENFNLQDNILNNYENIEIQSHKEDYSAGICHFNKGFSLSRYVQHAGLNYTFQGAKCMMVNSRMFYLNAGDMIYIPKNSIVFSNVQDCKLPFKDLDIELTPEIIKKHLGVKKNTYANLIAEPFVMYNHPKIRAFFGNFQEITPGGNDALENRGYSDTLIQMLAPRLFMINSKSSIVNDHSSVFSRMISSSLYDNLTIEQMANLCNMSLASFKRNFKAEFGIAPKKWVRNIRLQTAYFNLKTKKMNVSEVAHLTGFNSLPHFSYLFKKYFSISPSTLLSEQLS